MQKNTRTHFPFGTTFYIMGLLSAYYRFTVAPELHVIRRRFKLRLNAHLQNVLEIVIIAHEPNPVNVAFKDVFHENLRDLETGSRYKHLLEPSRFIVAFDMREWVSVLICVIFIFIFGYLVLLYV